MFGETRNPGRPDILGYEPVSNNVLADAARRLDVSLVGNHAFGLGRKSAGATAMDSDGKEWWLRVSGLIGTRHNRRRQAEIEAERLDAVTKPKVHRTLEWVEGNVFWRASLMTVAPSPIVSPHCWLKPGTTPPPDSWFDELRAAIAAIGELRTLRHCVTSEQVREGIAGIFGRRVPIHVAEWRVCHGDLHWSNLTAPNLMLLDWESWGLAPRGYDAARLIAYSGLVPDVQERLITMFADDLETSSGRVALLYALAMVRYEIMAGHSDRSLKASVNRIAKVVSRSMRPDWRRWLWS